MYAAAAKMCNAEACIKAVEGLECDSGGYVVRSDGSAMGESHLEEASAVNVVCSRASKKTKAPRLWEKWAGSWASIGRGSTGSGVEGKE